MNQLSLEGAAPKRPRSPMIVLAADGAGLTAVGWSYLWLKYVWGFAPEHHCANCLRGRFSRWVRPNMPLRQPRVLDEAPTFDFVYLCGIPVQGRWKDNLHFALAYAPGKRCQVTAFTGQVFTARNARRIAIAPLPRDYAGRDWRFTTCRNWRFGVEQYGLAPAPTLLPSA